MIYQYEKEVSAYWLEKEILDSSITIQLIGITASGSALSIEFKAALSTQEESALDSLVNSHEVIQEPLQAMPVKIDDVPINSPFASKLLRDGRSLFRRLVGKKYELVAGSNELIFTIPYAHAKITGAQLIATTELETASFYVLDSTTGTYTGIANAQLNQFGFDVVMEKDTSTHICKYDADIYQNMQIKIEYESNSAKTIGVNYFLDEVAS